MANNAPAVQIYSGLDPGEDGDPSPSPPPGYWEVLRQSRHDEIDRSYWLSLGHGDLYADAMENLQYDLERFTRSLYSNRMKTHRLGFDRRSVRFWATNVQLLPMDEEGNALDDVEGNALPLFLHYDARLLSRWKMLFYAMAGSKNWSFEVSSIEVPKVLMDGLADALKARAGFFQAEDWVSLLFRNNRLDMESALDLSRVVDRGVHLSQLFVNENDLSSPQVSDQLSKAIAKHSNLRTIDLSGSGIGRNTRSLAAITSCPNLDSLFLNNVSLESSGAAVVSEFLASNPLLQELELGHNQLPNNAAFSLAAALRTNSNMESLSLGDNDFSEAAADHFRGVIFDDSSLNAVLGCNHSCNVKGVPGLPSTLQCTKQKKKFRMICQRADGNGDFNHRLFADVPLELMPMVLAWIQSVPEDVSTPLTVLFETLRSWDLPLLFLGRHQPEEVKACLYGMISTIAKDEGGCSVFSYHQAVLPPLKPGEYDAMLCNSNSKHGLLFTVGDITVPDVTAVYGNPATSFLGYRALPDGSKGLSELTTHITPGDVMKAVNGVSIEGKGFREVVELLKNVLFKGHPFMHVRFQSREVFWAPVQKYRWHRAKAMLVDAQTSYNRAYEASLELQQKKANAMLKYRELMEGAAAESRNASEMENTADEGAAVAAEVLEDMLLSVQTRVQKENVQRLDKLFKEAEQNRSMAWDYLTKAAHTLKRSEHHAKRQRTE